MLYPFSGQHTPMLISPASTKNAFPVKCKKEMMWCSSALTCNQSLPCPFPPKRTLRVLSHPAPLLLSYPFAAAKSTKAGLLSRANSVKYLSNVKCQMPNATCQTLPFAGLNGSPRILASHTLAFNCHADRQVILLSLTQLAHHLALSCSFRLLN